MKLFTGIVEKKTIKTKIVILAVLDYFIFLSKIIFWFYTKNLTCRVLKLSRQKCIVLKFLNLQFQLLNLKKWWFYEGLKQWHYLWDTLYLLDSLLQETWVDAKDTFIWLLMKGFPKASICWKNIQRNFSYLSHTVK